MFLTFPKALKHELQPKQTVAILYHFVPCSCWDNKKDKSTFFQGFCLESGGLRFSKDNADKPTRLHGTLIIADTATGYVHKTSQPCHKLISTALPTNPPPAGLLPGLQTPMGHREGSFWSHVPRVGSLPPTHSNSLPCPWPSTHRLQSLSPSSALLENPLPTCHGDSNPEIYTFLWSSPGFTRGQDLTCRV